MHLDNCEPLVEDREIWRYIKLKLRLDSELKAFTAEARTIKHTPIPEMQRYQIALKAKQNRRESDYFSF